MLGRASKDQRAWNIPSVSKITNLTLSVQNSNYLNLVMFVMCPDHFAVSVWSRKHYLMDTSDFHTE